MFASFEITAQGLTKTDPKPKLIRSDDGCLPCRQKRKKCDNVKPVCGRCRNSYRRDRCNWPVKDLKQTKGTRSKKPHIPSEKDPAAPKSTSISPEGSTRSADAPELAVSLCPPRSLGEIPQFTLPETVTKVSPELSFNGVLQLSFDFQGKTLCDHANYDHPFLLLCFPIARAKPALLHAWIACSVSMLAEKSPYWRQKAIIHHNYSLKHLREDLQGVCDGSEEWLKATILTLHLFEAHGPSESRSASSTLHLNAAHQVFRRTLSMRLPASIHELMLLEAYMLRVATNCLFEPTNDLPLDYIPGLTRAYQSASSALGMTITWRTTPWVFPIGFELLDHVYRLSWLARRLPLNKQQILEAFSISRVLASLPTDTWAVSYSDVPWYISVVGDVFKYACSCLVSIILASSNQVAPNVDKSITDGLAAFEKLTEQRGVHPGLAWALAILGSAVSTRKDLNRCQSIGARLHGPAGGEVVARVLVLIDGVYELKSASAGRFSAQDLIQYIVSQTIFV